MKLPQEFDLHALEVFIMTVELGGMSQCAAHLQVTQSAVSQTIARLETGIGASLFDRTMRPLGLTASGKSLFARGHKLIAHARLAYDEVREGANLPISSVTVAMSFSLANELTAPILQHLGKLYFGVPERFSRAIGHKRRAIIIAVDPFFPPDGHRPANRTPDCPDEIETAADGRSRIVASAIGVGRRRHRMDNHDAGVPCGRARIAARPARRTDDAWALFPRSSGCGADG
jgi:DNA-binding transcriptional LysR family regulator